MKNFTINLLRKSLPQLMMIAAFLGLSAGKLFAQPAVTLSPNTTQTINAGGTVSFTATRNSNSTNWTGGDGNFTYTFSSPSGPATPVFTNNPATTTNNNSTSVVTFAVAGTYTIHCFVQEGGGGLNATSANTQVVVNAVVPTLTMSPSTKQFILTGSAVNYTATASNFAGAGTITYTWTAAGATIPAGNASTKSITFGAAGTYYVSVNAVRSTTNLNSNIDTVNVFDAPASPNLWAASSSGAQVSSFTVTNGVYVNGPNNIFDPTIGSTVTATAALGKNPTGGTGGDYYYWLPNSGTSGQVNVYAADAAGTAGSRTHIVTNFDVNGTVGTVGGQNLGFVRLGMGPDKTGWILAGDGSIIYLAKFASNALNTVVPTIESSNVILSGGSAATFQNGDIALDGNGTIYALANDGAGLTQIFVGAPAGGSTTLTKKWDLVDSIGVPFTGSVNGCAFDALGSMYISTAVGLYFIDANTINGPAKTVQCRWVRAVTGLQDLASNLFPIHTPLPVRLISFSGSLRNDITTLTWETDNEISFDHFDVERSSNGSDYAAIGNKPAAGGNGRVTYQYTDNLSSVSGTAFYYRLKMVDADGKFKYSNVILVRKDQKNIKGISLNPNPVINGIATARFNASADATVTFRVMDMSGKMLTQQTNKVYEGSNSVSISNLDRLQPGMYLLQLEEGGAVQNIKFSVSR